MKNIKILAIFLFLFMAHFQTKAQVDPRISWKRLTTEHFELVYDASHQNLADLYAQRLEAAHQALINKFPSSPDKTIVVLNDNTDLTNGYATVIPYPMIMVFPVLPSPTDTIGEYGDWSSELVTHEYTHILAMHPKRGAVSWLTYLFGSIMAPNILLPRWWHEGLAVEMETSLSNFGRLRSAYQDGSMRSYVLDKKLHEVSLAEINESTVPTWPYGSRPYLFGSFMWSEIHFEKKDTAINELVTSYSGRLPYLINGPAQDLLGQDYSYWFDKSLENGSRQADQQIQKLKTVDSVDAKELIFTKLTEAMAPQISPDQSKMAFIGKNDSNRRSLEVLQRPESTSPFSPEHLIEIKTDTDGEDSADMKPKLPKYWVDPAHDGPPGGSINRISWMPDSEQIVYDKISSLNRFHEVSDLYIYNFKTKKTDRLTTGARAREPSVSPDGKSIAFVKLQPGKSDLGLFNVSDKKWEIIYASAVQSRISQPTFLDAENLIFSLNENGKDQLIRFDIHSKTLQPILTQFPKARLPQMTTAGLIFTSTKNGVHNLYLADKDLKSAKPLTNSMTAIFGSTMDTSLSEVYSTQLSSQGMQLVRWSAEDIKKIPSDLPKISAIYSDRYPPYEINLSELKTKVVDDYSPAGYLIPRYWLPTLYGDANGTFFSLLTSGVDPLNKHSYQAYLVIDPTVNKTNYSYSYTNNTTAIETALGGFDTSTKLIGGAIKRTQQHSLQSFFEPFNNNSDWKMGLGYSWNKQDDQTTQTTQSGPTAQLSYFDYSMSGNQISPETGKGALARLTSFLAGQNQINYNLLDLSAIKYWSGPWNHHAIMLKAQAEYLDKILPISNYTYSASSSIYANSYSPLFLMRGYPSGQFLGKSLFQTTAEYRFPLRNIYSGSGTTPLFLRRIHGSFVIDAIALDGYGYNPKTKFFEVTDKSTIYGSYGAEAKIEMTLGYHFPMSFVFGAYKPAPSKFSDGSGGQIVINLVL